MPKQVMSPFHNNTLLTDAQRLSQSGSESDSGLLGLFYKRAKSDPETVRALSKWFTATDLAEKLRQDIEYWYDCSASVEQIASFEGLQYSVQSQGAAITWRIVSSDA